MRTLVLVLGLVLLAAVSPLVICAEEPSDSIAQQQGTIRCEQMIFCAGVKDKAPVGVSDVFPSDIYRVYCYTAIVGAPDTTVILHTWYRGETEMAVVELNVRAAHWRTWSSKRMAPGWQGPWKVEVTTADGAVIGSEEFSLE